MIRPSRLASLIVLLVPWPCFGQFGGMAPQRMRNADIRPVKVETIRSSCATGKMFETPILIDCDLGHYAIHFQKVKSVQLAQKDGEPVNGPLGSRVHGTVVTVSGDSYSGIVTVQNWNIETDLGTLTLDPLTLKSITFLDKDKDKDKENDKVEGEGKKN